jgi:hypothetical protein
VSIGPYHVRAARTRGNVPSHCLPTDSGDISISTSTASVGGAYQEQAEKSIDTNKQSSPPRAEEVECAVRDPVKEVFPIDMEKGESFFMKHIYEGEAAMATGTSYSILNALSTRGSVDGADRDTDSDRIVAALHFHKGIKIYPDAKALVQVYSHTVSEDVP